jgi:hypothetical protein
LQALLRDPAEAAAYVTAALADGDPALLHAALQHCAQAWGEALPATYPDMLAVEQWLRRHGVHLVLRPSQVQLAPSPLIQPTSSASVGLLNTPSTVYRGFHLPLERVRIQASPVSREGQ